MQLKRCHSGGMLIANRSILTMAQHLSLPPTSATDRDYDIDGFSVPQGEFIENTARVDQTDQDFEAVNWLRLVYCP